MNIDKVNLRLVFIHALFWLLYVASEYLANMMHLQPGNLSRFFGATLLSLPALIFATYFIALFIVPRFLQKNKWPQFLFWIGIVAAFVFFARIKWQELLIYIEAGHYYKTPVAKVLKNIIRDYSIIALAVCVYIISDYRQKQKLNEQLIKAKAEAEIKLLKGQLHPHFLFNSLNNIYSLALMQSELTAESILKLTELLDYLVYRANMSMVPLSKEVQLLDNYIGLEQLRYGAKLKINSDVQLQNEGLQVAPLLLLPFAENCFKHGGVGSEGIFKICIKLYADDQNLVFKITNSKKKNKVKSTVNGGLGLDNIRQRLKLLYPGNHQLNIRDLPEQYQVSLNINFK
ncbi:MAG: histidine kinase [Saprospiraceae bacterium]|nr:MAG: histidine kinase [Saprospiraceae bacterium]